MKLPIQAAPVTRYLSPAIASMKKTGIIPNMNGNQPYNPYEPGGIIDYSQRATSILNANRQREYQQQMEQMRADLDRNRSFDPASQSQYTMGAIQATQGVLDIFSPGPRGSFLTAIPKIYSGLSQMNFSLNRPT